MHIYEFVQAYWLDILLVLSTVLICVGLLRRGRGDLVRRLIYALVVEAEQQLGSKTGQEKKALVLTKIYERLPLLLRLIFTREEFSRWIDDMAAFLKDKLQSGDMTLLGYTEEQTRVLLAETECTEFRD